MCLSNTTHMVLLNHPKSVHPLGGLLPTRIGEVQISCQLHGNHRRGSIMLGTEHYHATPVRQEICEQELCILLLNSFSLLQKLKYIVHHQSSL
jgi:hypothetical protein